MHKAVLALLLALVGVSLMPQPATPEQYPSGTIRVISPGRREAPGTSAPAGPPNSSPQRWASPSSWTIERAPAATSAWKRPRRAPPTAALLVIVDTGALAMNPHLYDRTGYDALTDFVPVVRLARRALDARRSRRLGRAIRYRL